MDVRKGTGRARSLKQPPPPPVAVPGTCQPVCRWRRIVRKFTSSIPTSIGIGFTRFGPVGQLWHLLDWRVLRLQLGFEPIDKIHLLG
ncbi:hypothetical protein ACLKA6_003478 [Drosophila palustris]